MHFYNKQQLFSFFFSFFFFLLLRVHFLFETNTKSTIIIIFIILSKLKEGDTKRKMRTTLKRPVIYVWMASWRRRRVAPRRPPRLLRLLLLLLQKSHDDATNDDDDDDDDDENVVSSSSSSSSSSASFSANENVVGNDENENNYAPPEGERFKKVIGFRPSKIASSQGASYVSNPWRLRDATQSGEVNHWENPLQGYISFGSEGKVPKLLEFETREAMEQFCRKRRWTLEIMEKKETEHFTQRGSSIIPGAGKIGTQPKAYGDNFSVNGRVRWP